MITRDDDGYAKALPARPWLREDSALGGTATGQRAGGQQGYDIGTQEEEACLKDRKATDQPGQITRIVHLEILASDPAAGWKQSVSNGILSASTPP
jgi:hypothetical protein